MKILMPLPIYLQNVSGDSRNHIDFTYKDMKRLIKRIGKTNKQILEEVKDFISLNNNIASYPEDNFENRIKCIVDKWGPLEFYGYYADYDWVGFCWLFGKMNDLPKNFPMYCKDLKQILDSKVEALNWGKQQVSKVDASVKPGLNKKASFEEKLESIQEIDSFPKEVEYHDALLDAKWNLQLYKFLQSI
jgi:hypothetical protein